MGGGGKSRTDCDEMFGRSANWTEKHLALLKLPKPWQERVRSKEISYSAAQALVPFAEQAGVLQAIDRDMKKNPWAWHTQAEVIRSARLVSERLQAEAERKAAQADKATQAKQQSGTSNGTSGGTSGNTSKTTTKDPAVPSVRPGRPRVKNVRKLPASFRDEIRRLLFGIRTAVGDWPDGELPALCEALHALGDDLAETVEAKGGAK